MYAVSLGFTLLVILSTIWGKYVKMHFSEGFYTSYDKVGMVVRNADSADKIDKATPCCYGAPTVLVVAYDVSNVFTYPGGKRDSGIEDGSIVCS